MTDRERAIVMAYTGVVMLCGDKLNIFYEYISEKLGRPVWSHEFSYQADTIKALSKEDFLSLCSGKQHHKPEIFDEIKEAPSDMQPKNESKSNEDIRNWTPTMLYAKLRELENAFETLQQEYADKNSKIVNEYNLVQTAISNRDVIDRINSRDN